MHVMVATDGKVNVQKAADIAAKLASGNGKVTVFTVVEIPRQMLNDMRSAATKASQEAPNLDPEYRRAQAPDQPASHWAGDDAVVASYVKRCVTERTGELIAALDAAGVKHQVVGEEGENAARSVLEAAKNLEVDVLCIGTHGLGRFEGLLGSLSTKVARLAPCSVLLIR